MSDVPRIRPFDAADLDACYAISLATGQAGGDAAHLYRDPKMIGHIYVAPYALLAPDLTFVAEDAQGVAGFVAGTINTAAWEERLEREWWPALRHQYPDPANLPPEAWNADQRRAAMIHHPSVTPTDVATRYPAHLHMNLLPRLQRRGLGSRLLATWLAVAWSRGVRSLHVGVNRMNTGACRFWETQGFTSLTPDGATTNRTCWMGRDLIEPPDQVIV